MKVHHCGAPPGHDWRGCWAGSCATGHQPGHAVSGDKRRPRDAAHHVWGDRLHQRRLRLSRRCVYHERALRQRDLSGHTAQLRWRPQSGRCLELVLLLILTQSQTFPNPSTASGFTFRIGGVVPVRESDLYGPLFGERALTNGKKQLSVTFNINQLAFARLTARRSGTASAACSGATRTTTATAAAMSASAKWISTPRLHSPRPPTVC